MVHGLKLNLATRIYPETKGGLLLCGLNWGGDPSQEVTPEEPSFFSDERVSNYRFRARLVRWFDAWGHPLATKESEAGEFERSISQTNWWPDQAQHSRDVDIVKKCLEYRAVFFHHLREIEPALLIFLSVEMLNAINHPECLPEIRRILGQEDGAPVVMTKNVQRGDAFLKKFRVGVQRFERCEVVAMPHPSGAIGLADEYIHSFRTEMDSILCRYKRQKNL